MPADQRRTARLAVLLVAFSVVLVVWWWVAQGPAGQLDGQLDGRAGVGTSASATESPPRSTQDTPHSATKDASGLPAVAVADLPTQAQRTLDLIAAGGPYPYSRDGVVFQNRERLLPRKASGYYHEYTVPTPGEDDRGATRIITGRGGELYWTPDHYRSFKVILSSGMASSGMVSSVVVSSTIEGGDP